MCLLASLPWEGPQGCSHLIQHVLGSSKAVTRATTQPRNCLSPVGWRTTTYDYKTPPQPLRPHGHPFSPPSAAIAMPLTMPQLEAQGLTAVVSRLVGRRHYLLAQRICQALGLPSEQVSGLVPTPGSVCCVVRVCQCTEGKEALGWF